jgi:glycosyltransferase involved in cell wall biosynthesis
MKLYFSIVIPTLNEEKRLPKLLTDLSAQTLKDFEVIVADGNSDDNTVKKAIKFKDRLQNLTVLSSKKRHVCIQRNLGAKKAKADWIIFMDADNHIPNYFLQGIKYKIESTKPDILTTWIKPDSKHHKDQAISTIVNLFFEVQKTTKNPSVLESMLCIKKSAFKKLHGFNESLPWGEGGDLLRRAVKKNLKFEVVREPKYTYSLRRLRKQGTLTIARNVAVFELTRLRKKQLPKEKATYLYPMEGGKYFDQLDETSTSRLKNLVKKLYRITPLSREKQKKRILENLLKKIRIKKE